MIYCICPNPSIDKTLFLDNLALDQVNRVQEEQIDAGGKAINVARLLARLGAEVCAYAFCGGAAGRQLERLLQEEKLDFRPLWIEGETRTNIKLVDRVNKTFTDINAGGPHVSEELFLQAFSDIAKELGPEDYVLVSGSLTKGISDEVFISALELLKETGAKLLCDLSGAALKAAVSVKPQLIKPNMDELEELLGQRLDAEDKLKHNLAHLLQEVDQILISLGEVGILFVTEDSWLQLPAIKTEVVSTVGAGDSLLAGYLYAATNHLATEDALRFALASATAKIQLKGTEMPTREKIVELFESLA